MRIVTFYVGLLLLTVNGLATGTFVQSCQNSDGGSTTVTCPMGGTPTAGHLLIGAVYFTPNTLTVSSISDGGSTFTTKTKVNIDGDFGSVAFVACNAASTGATITITLSGTSGSTATFIGDYSGNATSSCDDGFNSGTGTGTAALSGSVVTTNTTNLIVGIGASLDDITVAGTDGNGHSMTLRGTGWAIRVEDVNVSATETATANATIGSSQPWVMYVWAIKAPAAAASLAPIRRVLRF